MPITADTQEWRAITPATRREWGRFVGDAYEDLDANVTISGGSVIIDGVPAGHSHDGTGVDSTILTNSNSGISAPIASGNGALSVGWGEATGDSTFAISSDDTRARASAGGAGAIGAADATSVGALAISSTAATVTASGGAISPAMCIGVGANHNASGRGAMVIATGDNGASIASGQQAIVVGGGGLASGVSSAVFGTGGQATHNASTSVGQGAQTTKANQLMLGKLNAIVATIPGGFERLVTKFTTGPQTLGNFHAIVTGDTTAAGFTINLPNVTTAILGLHYVIKNIGTGGNTLTVHPDAGTDNIDNSTADRTLADNEVLEVYASEADKWIMVKFGAP